MAVHQTRYILRETLRYDIQYPAELVLTSITLSRFCISIPRRVLRILKAQNPSQLSSFTPSFLGKK